MMVTRSSADIMGRLGQVEGRRAVVSGGFLSVFLACLYEAVLWRYGAALISSV